MCHIRRQGLSANVPSLPLKQYDSASLVRPAAVKQPTACHGSPDACSTPSSAGVGLHESGGAEGGEDGPPPRVVQRLQQRQHHPLHPRLRRPQRQGRHPRHLHRLGGRSAVEKQPRVVLSIAIRTAAVSDGRGKKTSPEWGDMDSEGPVKHPVETEVKRCKTKRRGERTQPCGMPSDNGGKGAWKQQGWKNTRYLSFMLCDYRFKVVI